MFKINKKNDLDTGFYQGIGFAAGVTTIICLMIITIVIISAVISLVAGIY